MSQAPENLLESDGLDEVLEGSAPQTGAEVPEGSGPPSAEDPEAAASPVVVVQYGNRARSWLLSIALIAVLTLGGLLAHNWRESRRLQVQTLQARRALERATEKARAEEAELQWMAAERSSVVMNPTPPAPIPVQPVPAPATAPATLEASGPSPAKPRDPTPAPAAGRAESRTSPPPIVLAKLPDKTEPSQTPKSRPDVPGPPPTASRTDAKAPVETAAIVPDSRSPFEELLGGGDDGPASARADGNASAAAIKAGTPAVAAAPPAEPPLPSREEFERQTLEEAALAQHANDARLAQQEQDLRALRDEDRRHFLDELEMLLKIHGKRAGPEIEQLTLRSGRKEDPKMLARARWVITESRTSQKGKVRLLRAMGVPETVILDYLANGLNRKLGARDGPRSRDEVWIQAARLLLNYSREISRPADTAAPGGRPLDRPAGAPQPAGRTARPQ